MTIATLLYGLTECNIPVVSSPSHLIRSVKPQPTTTLKDRVELESEGSTVVVVVVVVRSSWWLEFVVEKSLVSGSPIAVTVRQKGTPATAPPSRLIFPPTQPELNLATGSPRNSSLARNQSVSE